MFTASHNPAQYHGIKLARAGAKPIGSETGLAEIRKALIDNDLPTSSTNGVERKLELLEEYGAHLRNLVDCSDIRPLKVVIDAANGMAGHTVPKVLGPLNLNIVPMYFELDGTFPNHEANPLDSSTLKDLQQRVVSEGADLGLAFDGDADRCFLVDESGGLVAPSLLTALIAESELAKAPGSTIIYSLISSRIVPQVGDVIASMTRVENHFSGEGEVDRLDGLTISSGHWWLNVRPSNTEPLLRLNVEADNDEIMCAIRDAALEVIRQ